MLSMTRHFCVFLVAVCCVFGQGEQGWIKMFDGKTLDGWKAGERPEG